MVAACIGADIASALAYAHASGIIHRDVKPGNILLAPDGTTKLVDLGLAKGVRKDDFSLTQTGVSIGTPYYMSPEQINAEKDIDGRSDAYGLGCTLYEAVTGTKPFEAESSAQMMIKHLQQKMRHPMDLDPTLSKAFCAVLDRLVACKREDRYPDLELAEQDLRAIAEGDEPACTPPVPAKSRFRRREVVSKTKRRPSCRLAAVSKKGMPAASTAIQRRALHGRRASTSRLRPVKPRTSPAPLVGGIALAGVLLALLIAGFLGGQRPVTKQTPTKETRNTEDRTDDKASPPENTEPKESPASPKTGIPEAAPSHPIDLPGGAPTLAELTSFLHGKVMQYDRARARLDVDYDFIDEEQFLDFKVDKQASILVLIGSSTSMGFRGCAASDTSACAASPSTATASPPFPARIAMASAPMPGWSLKR